MLMAARKDDGSTWAPPMVTWSTEADLLATAIEEIRRLTFYTRAVAGDKKAPKPEPYPRPRTAFRKAEHATRKERHEALAARLLPHKAKK